MLTVKYRRGHREENINWDASKQTRVDRAHGGTVQCKKDTEVSDVFFDARFLADCGTKTLLHTDTSLCGMIWRATRQRRGIKRWQLENARKCFAGDSTLSSTLSDVL